MIKLVVLDFDDTLSISEEATFVIENMIAEEMGHSPMSREAHRKNWGKPLDLAIAERIPGIDVGEFLERLNKVHYKFAEEGRVDVITKKNLDSLDKLISKGYKLAILTARSEWEVRHLMHQDHVLSKRIERFYHKDNLQFPKPDPKAFDVILSDFNVRAHEAVYMGDAPSDATCAKAAGLHFVAILESGVREEKDFEGLGVDYFSTTFVEAVNYIVAL